MSTSKAHQQVENVKSGDGAPPDSALPPDLKSTKNSRDRTGTRTPSHSRPPAGKPSGRHKRDVEQRFKAVEENAGHLWNAGVDEVYTFLTACESPIEKLFLLDLLEETAKRVQHASTMASRPDNWSIKISAPFQVQRSLPSAPWIELHPQYPIWQPGNMKSDRDDVKSHWRVDFLAEVKVDPSPPRVRDPMRLCKFAIEIDGQRNHSGQQQSRGDYRQNRKLQRRLGTHPIRFMGSEINDSQKECASEALATIWEVSRERVHLKF